MLVLVSKPLLPHCRPFPEVLLLAWLGWASMVMADVERPVVQHHLHVGCFKDFLLRFFFLKYIYIYILWVSMKFYDIHHDILCMFADSNMIGSHWLHWYLWYPQSWAAGGVGRQDVHQRSSCHPRQGFKVSSVAGQRAAAARVSDSSLIES